MRFELNINCPHILHTTHAAHSLLTQQALLTRCSHHMLLTEHSSEIDLQLESPQTDSPSLSPSSIASPTSLKGIFIWPNKQTGRYILGCNFGFGNISCAMLSVNLKWLFKGGIHEMYKIFILTASPVQEHSSFTSLKINLNAITNQFKLPCQYKSITNAKLDHKCNRHKQHNSSWIFTNSRHKFSKFSR